MDRSYFIPRRREATGITRFLTVIRPDLLLLINLLHHTGVKLASVFANTNTIRNRSSTRVLNIFCKKESVCVTIETIDIVQNRNRDTGGPAEINFEALDAVNDRLESYLSVKKLFRLLSIVRVTLQLSSLFST